jgi:hypothetical protein
MQRIDKRFLIIILFAAPILWSCDHVLSDTEKQIQEYLNGKAQTIIITEISGISDVLYLGIMEQYARYSWDNDVSMWSARGSGTIVDGNAVIKLHGITGIPYHGYMSEVEIFILENEHTEKKLYKAAQRYLLYEDVSETTIPFSDFIRAPD